MLGANHFTGPIPITFSNASKLEKFDVSFNNIVGPVPFSLKDLKSLKWLSLGQNQLGMGSANDLSFLTSLSNSSHLEGLSLHDNSFGGAFPNCIINLTASLRYLYMGRTS